MFKNILKLHVNRKKQGLEQNMSYAKENRKSKKLKKLNCSYSVYRCQHKWSIPMVNMLSGRDACK